MFFVSALSATKKEFLYEKETEFTGFCHPAACRADLHQLHGHQQNRSAVRGERKRMDIFAALRSRNRSVGHLCALLAAGHQTGGTVCGVCESGDGAFVVTFVGGITVRGADYGEKTHRRRTGACRDADYQRRKGAGKS